MIPQNYKLILEGLNNKTVQGAANWRTTSDERKFIIYFSNFSLSISSGFDSETGSSFVQIAIYNDNGEQIDIFWVDDSTDQEYKFLFELYQSARRNALKIDLALTELLREINNEGPIGQPESIDDVPF